MALHTGTEIPALALDMRKAVGARIRSERRAGEGYTLAQISEALTRSAFPMTVAVLSKLEKGERPIDVGEVAAICKVLGVPDARVLGVNLDDAALPGLREQARELELEKKRIVERQSELDRRERDLEEQVGVMREVLAEMKAKNDASS